MVENKILFRQIKETVKRYVKWYLYPLIYFLVVCIVCAYAWYNNPITQRAGIKVIFKTIGIIPIVIWIGFITSWIFITIIFILISLWLKKKFPKVFSWNGFKRFSELGNNLVEKIPFLKEKKAPQSLWKKIVNSLLYTLSLLLIFAGLTLVVWIARPYINLLLSSSKIEALERKAELRKVQGNRIIIPAVLVDAPILEGLDKGKLSLGVSHIPNSPAPGEGGNCIIEGHNLAEFGLWRPQSFFSLLEAVGKGTPVYVFYNGRKYTYKVKEKTYLDVGDPKFYNTTLGERLTLITCVSTWSPTIYTKRRTVVIASPEF